MINRGRRRVEAVVAAGPGIQNYELRRIPDGDLEGEPTGNIGRRDDIVERTNHITAAGHSVDNSNLRIDWAVIRGEVGDRTLRCGMRVTDKPSRHVDGSVFGILAVTGALALLSQSVLDVELHLNIGVTASLCGRGKRGERDNRSVGRGVVGDDPGQTYADQRQAQRIGLSLTDRSDSICHPEPSRIAYSASLLRAPLSCSQAARSAIRMRCKSADLAVGVDTAHRKSMKPEPQVREPGGPTCTT